MLPSPAPSEEPSPAVSTTYETTSPPGGGNPHSIPAPTASSEPYARATGPDTVLARPPSRTTLANGSVGAQGGRDSRQPSTATMTAAPATTTAPTSLQTPPTSNDPVFSQGLPNPTYQVPGVAQEHRAKRRRMGYVSRGYRGLQGCYTIVAILTISPATPCLSVQPKGWIRTCMSLEGTTCWRAVSSCLDSSFSERHARKATYSLLPCTSCFVSGL